MSTTKTRVSVPEMPALDCPVTVLAAKRDKNAKTEKYFDGN